MELTGRVPAVAVVVPAFNAAGTLAATLDSVRAQTLTDFEAIVVDDGSSDATLAIASDFARRDTRFKVLHKANSGVADARNLGITTTTAELIAPLDADDVWHPTFLERMCTALAGSPDAVLVYANTRVIDIDGNVLRNAPPANHCGRVFDRLLLRNFIGNGSAMMFRRELGRRFGFYERRLQHEFGAEGAEDWLLSVQLAALGRVALVREYLVGYRVTPGAMSTDVLRTRRSRLHALLLLIGDGLVSNPVVRRRALGRAYGKCFLRKLQAGELPEAARDFWSALRADWFGTCHLLMGPPRGQWLSEQLFGVKEAVERRPFFDIDTTDRYAVPDHPTDEPGWWQLDASNDPDRPEIVLAVMAREVHPE
ncbi:MAG: glycosyltransferase [Steroidobacteraceae bacterium]